MLLHTLQAFASAVPGIDIILVLPEDHIVTWEEILVQHNVEVRHTIVPGGETRFQSVKNGLRYITAPGMVAVHDGVRPLISKNGITRLFDEAENFDSAVPVIPVSDTVRQAEGEHSRVIDRNNLYLVQTPEIFPSGILISAFEIPESDAFTDVTSVIECSGLGEGHLCEGEAENIKITRPVDFLLAEAILEQRGEVKFQV